MDLACLPACRVDLDHNEVTFTNLPAYLNIGQALEAKTLNGTHPQPFRCGSMKPSWREAVAVASKRRTELPIRKGGVLAFFGVSKMPWWLTEAFHGLSNHFFTSQNLQSEINMCVRRQPGPAPGHIYILGMFSSVLVPLCVYLTKRQVFPCIPRQVKPSHQEVFPSSGLTRHLESPTSLPSSLLSPSSSSLLIFCVPRRCRCLRTSLFKPSLFLNTKDTTFGDLPSY